MKLFCSFLRLIKQKPCAKIKKENGHVAYGKHSTYIAVDVGSSPTVSTNITKKRKEHNETI